MFRLEQLVTVYNGWYDALFHGIPQIHLLFPQLGLTAKDFDADYLAEHYPGNITLFDFVATSAHSIDSTILL